MGVGGGVGFYGVGGGCVGVTSVSLVFSSNAVDYAVAYRDVGAWMDGRIPVSCVNVSLVRWLAETLTRDGGNGCGSPDENYYDERDFHAVSVEELVVLRFQGLL